VYGARGGEFKGSLAQGRCRGLKVYFCLLFLKVVKSCY